MIKYYFPKYALAKQLRQPGGKAVAEALIDANAALAALRPACLEHIDRTLRRMEKAFESLDGDESGRALGLIYEAANDLVGPAATARLVAMDRAAYSLCDLADRMATSGAVDTQALRVHLNALQVFRSLEATGEAFDPVPVLLGLRKVRDKYGAVTAPTASRH